MTTPIKDLAKIEKENVHFYVFKAEEIDGVNELCCPLKNNLYLSHMPNIDDLFNLFSHTLSGYKAFDYARPQWWNDQHFNTPEYHTCVWLYDDLNPLDGRAFDPFSSWAEDLNDLALKVWTENQEVQDDNE